MTTVLYLKFILPAGLILLGIGALVYCNRPSPHKLNARQAAMQASVQTMAVKPTTDLP